jgi:hypothetical protein
MVVNFVTKNLCKEMKGNIITLTLNLFHVLLE